MNHTLEATINKPLDEVITFYKNPEKYPLWMEGLKEHRNIKGSHGEEGTESVFVFDMKGREMELKEAVLISDFPHKHAVQYNTPGMIHTVEFEFSEIDEQSTKIINHNDFQFSGFMKIMSFFMGGALKKQSQKYLDAFKSAAEEQ